MTLLTSFLHPGRPLGGPAHGAFLSGSGTTVLALTSGRKGDIHAQRSAERKEVGDISSRRSLARSKPLMCSAYMPPLVGAAPQRAVINAMYEAATRLGEAGRLTVTQPSELGAHVVRTEPPIVWPVVPSRTGTTNPTAKPA